MAREKTITVDGKKITVRDRDFYLWTQYNRGNLTRAEVRAFQAVIPEDTSTHKTAQAVKKGAPAAAAEAAPKRVASRATPGPSVTDRSRPTRTITYEGERIKVSDRDFALYTMVKEGEITEADLRRYQQTLPPEVNTAVKATQAVHADQRERAVPGGPVAAAGAAGAPAGEIRGGPAGGPGPLDPRDDAGIVIGSELLQKGVLTTGEYRDLLIITRGSEAPEEVVGMAMEAYGITPNELKGKNWVTFDAEKVEETSVGGAIEQRRRRDWLGGITGQFESGLGNIAGAIREHFFTESEQSKARQALRKGLEEQYDDLIESGDLTRTKLDDMISRLGNPMNEEMLADYAGEVVGFIDLGNIEDPEAAEVLTTLTGGVTSAIEGVEEVPTALAEGAPIGKGLAAGQVPEQIREAPAATPFGRPVTEKPGTLAEYKARLEAEGKPWEVQPGGTGQVGTPAFTGYIPQVSPGISHPLAMMGEVPGDFWYNKAAAPGEGAILSQAQYQAIVAGAEKVARDYAIDADVQAYYAANEAPMSYAAEQAKTTYEAINYRSADTESRRTRQLLMGEDPGAWQVRTPAPLADQPWEQAGFDWQPGEARAYWDNSSPERQRMLERQITNNGLLDSYLEGSPYATGVGTSPFSENPQMIIGVLDQVLGVSRGEQIDPFQAIGKLGGYVRQVRAWQSASINAARAAAAATSPVKQPFSIPLSLRYIPDKREIAQDTKATFEAKLGRKALPGELTELSNELTGFHRRKQSEMIDLAYAYWEGSDTPDDYDLEEVITDPSKVLAEEVENKWANEINLNERQERQSDSFSRIMRATGGNMGSMGTTRAAGGDNVVRI